MPTFRLLLLVSALAAALTACGPENRGLQSLPVQEPRDEERRDPEEPTNVETLEGRGEQEEIPVVANDAPLCTFGRRATPVAMIYRDRDGSPIHGEVPPQNYGWFQNPLPSALARPNADTYRIVRTRDCRDPDTGAYYSCPEVQEIALADIRGIARADTLEEAERLAARACRLEVQRQVFEELQTRVDSNELDCHVIEQRRCRTDAAN